MKQIRRFLGILLALLLVLALPVQALAETYDIADGDVTITADETGQYSNRTTGDSDTREKSEKGYKESTATVITGSSSGSNANTVTIKSEGDAAANVTFQDVKIDASKTGTGYPDFLSGEAAVTVSGNAEITLKGENEVTGAYGNAGVEVEEGSSLTISGGETDSLTAKGGLGGAGIGGGSGGNGGTITVKGGQVTANGGSDAAGIGGGYGGNGGTITVEGGQVTANGGYACAGIGGGFAGFSVTVNISGGQVTANGGDYAAGIGSGSGGYSCETINISGGQVTANGGDNGAGIGGAGWDNGGTITISGGKVEAIGGNSAAGIGSCHGDGGTVTISGGQVEATGGEEAADIGSGYQYGKDPVVTITGGTVNGVNYDPAPAPEASAPQEKASSESQDTFWNTINWQLTEAPEGSTFTADAAHRTWAPNYVIKTAQSRNITLVIQWDGGEDITIAPDTDIDLSQWCVYFDKV